MIRRIILPAILFLAVAIIGASIANAIVRHYALYALENMAVDGYAIGQEIRTAVEEISQIFQRETGAIRGELDQKSIRDAGRMPALRPSPRMRESE